MKFNSLNGLKFGDLKFKFQPLDWRKLRQADGRVVALVLGIGACFGLAAFGGYKLGDMALGGVSQPEENPIEQLNAKADGGGEVQAKFTPVNVAKVSKETRIYIQKQKSAPKNAGGATKDNQASQTADKDTKSDSKPEAEAEKKP